MKTQLEYQPSQMGFQGQEIDETSQVCTPHRWGEAKVRAVTARVRVPAIGALRAVAKMPAPARPRQVVEW